MAGQLDYILKLQADAFTGPVNRSIGATDRLGASVATAGAKIGGLQTSTSQAGAGMSSLLDKAAHLGGNIANVVAGVKAANEAFTFLRGGASKGAAGATQLAAASMAAATGSTAASTASRIAGASFGFAGATAAGAALGVGALATAVGVLAAPLVAIVGGIAAFKAVSKGIGMAAELEQTEVAFTTLVGSAEKAHAVLSGIKQLGAETPFEFPELADAGRKLIAFGESAGGVTGALRMIGDVASGVQAPIGEIAEIYGKARVQGTLFAEDINQLTGRGIPVIQEFAKVLGVSESEVKKLAEAGNITFPMLEQAFQNLTTEGGKFHGMMAAQSQTTIGLLSTLKDNIGQILTVFGKPLNDGPIKESLKALVAYTGAAATAITAAFEQNKIGEAFKNALILGAKMGINGLLSLFADLPGMMMAPITAIGNAIKAALSGNAGEIGKILGSFSMKDMKFDTGPEEQFFKTLVADAESAAEKMKKALADSMVPETPAPTSEPKEKGAKKKTGTKEVQGLMDSELGPKNNPNPKKTGTKEESTLTDNFYGPAGGPDPRPATDKFKDAIAKNANTIQVAEQARERERDSAFDGKRRKIYGYGSGVKAFAGVNPELEAAGEAKARVTRREAAKQAKEQAARAAEPRWDLVEKIADIMGGIQGA